MSRVITDGRSAPRKPKVGALWAEPYTRTLRIWNGKLWWETSPKEVGRKIAEHGSLSKWMIAEHGEEK